MREVANKRSDGYFQKDTQTPIVNNYNNRKEGLLEN